METKSNFKSIQSLNRDYKEETLSLSGLIKWIKKHSQDKRVRSIFGTSNKAELETVLTYDFVLNCLPDKYRFLTSYNKETKERTITDKPRKYFSLFTVLRYIDKHLNK